jgi:Methyltransferase domain
MLRFEVKGHCPVCEQETAFVAEREEDLAPEWWGHWFRSDLKCQSCNSIPRERALLSVLMTLRPNWRTLAIHESSPSARGASLRLRHDCPGYIATQYDTSLAFGTVHPEFGYRSEDLAAQTFPDSKFDVVVTQDVFEHLFSPASAISEIARTLKPDGISVMTVPIVRKDQPSARRAVMNNGVVEHLLLPPQYHGNPMDPTGSLVTVDWGMISLPSCRLTRG